MLGSIRRAQELGIHVETRTNVIPSKNDDLDELRRIAEWIRDNLGADSPWHVTKFFPAHTDISCDCATENAPISAWLELDAAALNAINKCAASCCGDEGILVKKFEREAGLLDEA